MKLGAWAVALSSLLLTIVASAQQPPDDTAAAPSPRDVHLLNEVPTYGEIFDHQWRDGVPEDVTKAQESTEFYGLLVDLGPTQEVSLGDCVALAVKNNTDLQIQRLAPVAASAQVRRARSVFDPRVVADTNWSRQVTPSTTFLTAGGNPSLFTQDLKANAGVRKTLLSGGTLSFDWTNERVTTNPSIASPIVPRYVTALGLSLNQPLLRDFGWRYSLLLVEIAQNTEQASYYQYAASIANIVSRVEQAYWNLVLAIEAVQVQGQSLALAQELQRQNEGKFNVGALAQTAVLEAKSEVASREATLIRARNLAVIARDNLRAVINAREEDAPALMMITPRDKPTITEYAVDLQRSLQTGLEQRPELVAARLGVRGAGLQRKIAENQLLPRLNVLGSLGVNGLGGSDAMVPDIFSPTPGTIPINRSLTGGYGNALGLLPDGRYYNYGVGAAVEIPLDNAQAKADYSKANIELERSRLSLRQIEEGVTLEIKQAASNLATDLKSIDATRIARELAAENLRNQQARYDVGLATTKDLLDFQDKLTQARFREIDALTRYNTDLAEMRRVEGSLLSARNILIERITPEKAPWWAQF